MKNQSAFKRVNSELQKYGATPEQSQFYISQVLAFAKFSKGVETDEHHILPVNFYDWKKYDKCNWNSILISRGGHLALHGILMDLFQSLAAIGSVKLIASSSGSYVKQARKQEIVKWNNEGKSNSWISKQVNVSSNTVDRWLREWGFKSKFAFRVKSKAFLRRITQWYKSGKSVNWIMNKTKFTNVRNWLISQNIKLRGQKQWSPARKRKRDILKWYKSGRSAISISKEIGCSNSSVLIWLREWGISIRAVPESLRASHIYRAAHQ